ncbi:DinB family protein [Capsulimonas corticalis]|nr:DinB family protein [Capsulimonas corticalis]
MQKNANSLWSVYDGWDGYQTSLVNAVSPLTREQLVWRPMPGLRSLGEVAEHISFGRIDWFLRMDAPRSAELDRLRPSVGSLAEDAAALSRWLEMTWGMVEETLSIWTVEDLAKSYPHTYWGKTYAVSHQWTIWRILSHDIHHGGQLSLMLAAQGISAPELCDLGGHLTEPPLADL